MRELVFFFNDTATTEIYTLSLHDALPILTTSPIACAMIEHERIASSLPGMTNSTPSGSQFVSTSPMIGMRRRWASRTRSEEHTSELQSRQYLVCRLLLEKKK